MSLVMNLSLTKTWNPDFAGMTGQQKLWGQGVGPAADERG